MKSNESECAMRYLCGYCKYHKCGKESEEACVCMAKRKAIEHWYMACSNQFKDRRDNGKAWTGPERRRLEQVMARV